MGRLFAGPLREETLVSGTPRPEPDLLPPSVSLLTVAQAQRSASSLESPGLAFCLSLYFDLSPRGMTKSPLWKPGDGDDPCVRR